MKLTEQQVFDYIACPAKYDMKYNRQIDIPEDPSLSVLINKVIKYFFINLFNGKICSANELKNKWDSICVTHSSYIDSKKNLQGIGLIIQFLRWAADSKLVILDIDTGYSIPFSEAEITGNIGVIAAAPNNKIELLVVDTSSKMPDLDAMEMKLKYTLDVYAFNKIYNKKVDGIHIHNVKYNKDFYTTRTESDFQRLIATINNVAKGISQNVFYPRESVFCSTCKIKDFCKYWY